MLNIVNNSGDFLFEAKGIAKEFDSEADSQ